MPNSITAREMYLALMALRTIQGLGVGLGKHGKEIINNSIDEVSKILEVDRKELLQLIRKADEWLYIILTKA